AFRFEAAGLHGFELAAGRRDVGILRGDELEVALEVRDGTVDVAVATPGPAAVGPGGAAQGVDAPRVELDHLRHVGDRTVPVALRTPRITADAPRETDCGV